MLDKYCFIKKINLFIFISIIIVSFFTIIHFFSYSTFQNHDFWLFYNRTIWDGQHGRYLTTILQNILEQRIPDLLNIHTFDINLMITLKLKAFLIVLCILFYLFSFELTNFTIKNKININLSHSLLYLTLFLILFNNNYIFNETRQYFCINENAVFFEYPVTMIFYIVFWFIYTSVFINSKENNLQSNIKRNLQILLMIIALIISTSIEIVNIPTLMSLFALSFIIFKFKFQNKCFFYKILGIYFIGLFTFLIDEKSDFTPYHFFHFMEFIETRFLDFVNVYFNEFIKINSLIVIPIIILLILITVMCKKNEMSKKFISIVCVNIICIFVFYFLTFFLAGTDGDEIIYSGFPIGYYKWLAIHKMILLFWLILSIGYFLNNNDFKFIQKYSSIIKILICVFILIIFRNNLIFDYIPNLNITRIESKERLTMLYIVQKLSLLDASDNIIIPLKYENMFNSLINPEIYDWYILNFNYSFKTNKSKIVFLDVDNETIKNNFSQTELNDLKFSKLQEFIAE